jgi:hypothetical protein
MLTKSAIREYFIQKIKGFVVSPNITEKLEKLSIFSGDKKQLDMKQFWNEFSQNIISFDLINYAEVYITQKQHLDKLDLIIAVQTWAITAWKKGLETVDINKIIISYILIDRLFLFPDVDLDWNFDEVTKDKLRKYLKRLPEIITLDVSTNIPENASYEDRKFHSDYQTALKEKDHRGIITFFSALERGVGFHTQFDYFIEITAKLSAIVAPCIFAENLSKFTPYGVRYYFEYLNTSQIAEVLTAYTASEPLPLLIGIIQIVNPHGNNQFDKELIEDNKLIEKAVLAVEKITQLVSTPNIFNYITDCSNIFMNELWHKIFSAFIAKNFQYHQQYLDAIDFSYNVGEHSFNGFITHSENIDDLDVFSCKIYYKYLNSLVGKHSNRYINFTSYFKYISQAIFVLTSMSHQRYIESLEQVSIELKRGIYSWKNEELSMSFTKWFFWLLSSKDYIERVEVNRDILKITYELINDIRITNTLEIDSASLIALIENPGRAGDIAFPVAGSYGQDKISISWDVPKTT